MMALVLGGRGQCDAFQPPPNFNARDCFPCRGVCERFSTQPNRHVGRRPAPRKRLGGVPHLLHPHHALPRPPRCAGDRRIRWPAPGRCFQIFGTPPTVFSPQDDVRRSSGADTSTQRCQHPPPKKTPNPNEAERCDQLPSKWLALEATRNPTFPGVSLLAGQARESLTFALVPPCRLSSAPVKIDSSDIFTIYFPISGHKKIVPLRAAKGFFHYCP